MREEIKKIKAGKGIVKQLNNKDNFEKLTKV